MKFAFVECTEVSNPFAEVVPDDEAVVPEGLVKSSFALFIKGAKMAIQGHVSQKYLPSKLWFAFC